VSSKYHLAFSLVPRKDFVEELGPFHRLLVPHMKEKNGINAQKKRIQDLEASHTCKYVKRKAATDVF